MTSPQEQNPLLLTTDMQSAAMETAVPSLPRPAEAPAIESINLEETVEGPQSDTAERGQGIRAAFRRARYGLEMAIVAAEITPANEALRFSAFGAAELAGAPTPVSAAVLGGATVLIEGAAALSTADLLGSKTGENTIARINDRIKKSRTLSKVFSPDQRMSPLVEAGVAFGGGTAVTLMLKQREDPTRTVNENRRRGLLTATYLGGALTVTGAMASEGIETVPPTAIGATLLVAGGVSSAVKGIKNRRQERTRSIDERADWSAGRTYKIATDPETLEAAATLEQDVWNEQEYGDLKKLGYDAYTPNSRTFVSIEDGECVGMTRLFRGSEELTPPFLEYMPFDDDAEKQALIQGSIDGSVEELGTTAVVADLRSNGVNTHMWRLAFRDAYERGVKQWGIIQEPERAQKMNKYHGFGFRQLGEAIDYQGGDCAAFVMDFDNLKSGMKQTHPLSYYWFVKKSLKPLV